MQSTIAIAPGLSRSVAKSRPLRAIRARTVLAAMFVAVCALVLAGCFRPASAWAADYRCLQADMTAQVETDGTMTVVDQRIFAFAPSEDDEALAATGPQRQTLKWLYDGFTTDAEIAIKRVRMASVDAEGNVTGDWIKLKSTTFQLSWRDGGGPEHEAWSYDKHRSTLYAFVDSAADRVVFEVTYVVRAGIVAYDDAADLSWEYAPRDYPVPMHQVTATVVLPVPADDAVEPGQNVRAWGHGPADGTVDIETDGSVTFADPEVDSQAYAMGRVMFPVGWLPNLPEDIRLANQGSLQYGYTTRYEEGWVDSEAYREITRDGLAAALMALSAVLVLLGLAAYARWGRQKPPAFKDDYYTQVPDAGLAPAVLGRLWRWNHLSTDDVVATLADMVRRGVIVVEPSAEDDCGSVKFEPWEENCEAISERDSSDAAAVMDAPTLRLLTFMAQGGGLLTARSMADFAREHPGTFLRAVYMWQQALTRQVEPHGFFDRGSRRVQHVMLAAAALLALAAVVAILWLNWQAGILALVSAGALGVLANYTMRRSAEGNEIVARAKALRNWLREGGVQEADLTPEQEAVFVPYGLLFDVLYAMPETALSAWAYEADDVMDEALRNASRRAEVAGNTGEAPAEAGVVPHWRPFWRRPVHDAPIDDDF